MKFFKNAITDFTDWTNWILQPIKDMFGTTLPEWLDDTQSFYTQEQIYTLFNQNFRNMVVRYSTKEDFCEALKLVMVDKLPKLFVSTLAFVNNEFQKLKDAQNRGDFTLSQIQSDNKQKTKQGIPPSDLIMQDDLSNLNIKNAQFLENLIKDSHNTQTTNLLNNLKQIIQSNISGVILNWLKGFTFLFTSLLTDEFEWNPRLTDVLYQIEKNMDEWNTTLADFDDKFTKLEDLLNSDNDEFQSISKQVINNTTNISDLQTQQATNISNISDLQTQQATNISNISDLQTQQATNTSNINNLNTNVNTLQSEIIDIPNKYVDIDNSQIINGAKYFTNGLILKQKENSSGNTTYSGYTQYRDSSDNVLENVGFVSGNDTKNGNMTYTFQNSKVINVPSYDITNSNFGDNSLVTKKYVDNNSSSLIKSITFTENIDNCISYENSNIDTYTKYFTFGLSILWKNNNKDISELLDLNILFLIIYNDYNDSVYLVTGNWDYATEFCFLGSNGISTTPKKVVIYYV